MARPPRQVRTTRFIQGRKGDRLHITGPCVLLLKGVKDGRPLIEAELPEATKLAHVKRKLTKPQPKD